mgnify:FL=1|tara:strand:- start:250 stop:459 length:210 start_codon:yes stop_codon:yes gene_type:complete
MNQGDLIHIPQGVQLWSDAGRGMRHRTTDRPIVGVYLGGTNTVYQVYANGAEWNLKRRDVYPLENEYVS